MRVGLRPREPAILELGFHLRPEHRGQGLAHEAAVATIAYAFARADVAALFAGHHPDNAASQRLLARLGFRFRGEVFFPPTGLMHRGYLLERPR
jgi:RimJ/RimL family protein N-acetyltransferase